MKSTFKFKILVVMLMTFIIPIVLLLLFININGEIYYEKFIPESTKENVEKDLSEIEQFFIEKEASLLNISQMIPLDDSDEHIYNLLDYFLEKYPSFINAYYSKENGVGYTNNFGKPPIDGTTRNWYKEAVKNNGFTISAPYIDVITQDYVTTLSIPVYKNEQLMGVLGVDFLMSNIIENTKKLTHLNNVSYIIEDHDGKIIYYDKLLYINEKYAKDALIKAAESEGYILNEFYMPHMKLYLKILFYADEYQINKSIIGIEISFMLLIVLAIAMLLSVVSSEKLSRPLKEFKLRIDASNFDYLPEATKVIWDDEFTLLFEKFNILLEKVILDKLKISKKVEELQEKNNNLIEKNIALESIYKNLKLLDNKIRKSRADYESILDNVKGMIWVLNKDGEIVFVNQDLLSHLNYHSEDLKGRSGEDLIVNSYKNYFSFLDIVKSRDYKKIELSLIDSENQKILVEASTSRITDDHGELLFIYGICRNIRDSKILFYDYNMKIQEQNLMMELTETASMNISMIQIVKVIFDKMYNIFGWSIGTIRFLTENNEFELVAKTDLGLEYIMDSSIANEDTCLSKVIEINRIVYAKENDDLPVLEDSYIEMIENGYVVIFIPVGNEEIGKGVITLGIDRTSMSDKEEILKSFTNTILLVVERALVYEKLKNDYIRMIKVLAEAGDDKDSITKGHSNRVANYAKKIGEHLYLDEDEIVDLEICGLLHDIGKIGISDEFLKGKDDVSIEKIKEHPLIGKRMLKDIGLAQSILEGIEMHHMNFDLSGYPSISYIDSLPLFARIIQVADSFDNIKEQNPEESNLVIYEMMDKETGILYCPQVMRVLKTIIIKNELLS